MDELTIETPKNVRVNSGPAENMRRSMNKQMDVMIAGEVGM